MAIAAESATADEFPRLAGLMALFRDDREMRAVAAEYREMFDGFVRGCLEEARSRGQIRVTDIGDLTATIVVVANGAFLTHIMRPDQSHEEMLRSRVAAVLRPYRMTAAST